MAFSTAITGLKASTTELDVTGNNIANASTVGFKSGRTEFADIFSTVVVGSGSANSAGSGVIVSDIAQDFTAGTIQFTNNNLDLAIDGSGFFQLNDGKGGISYTRAGGFELDKDGFVVSKTGRFLQGFGLDKAGNKQPIGNLAVSQKESPPKATEQMGLSFNIDSRLDGEDLLRPYDPNDSQTFSFSTTSRSFDSLGNENTIKFDYVEQGPFRERQVVSIANSAAATNGNAVFAGVSIPVVGVATPGAPSPTEIADAINTSFNTPPTPDPYRADFRNSIEDLQVDPNNSSQLIITYKASATDVDPAGLDLSAVGYAAGDITVTEDANLGAEEVQSVTVATPTVGSGQTVVQFGNVPFTVNEGETAAAIVDRILKDQAKVLAVNPTIDSLEQGPGGQIIINYLPEFGDVSPLAVDGNGSDVFRNQAAAVITEAEGVEKGDNSYEGKYRMFAYLNNDELLDIGKSVPPNIDNTTSPISEPGAVIITFDNTNGLLATVNGSPVTAGGAPKLTIVGADKANPIESTITLDITGSTQFASESIVKTSAQDGFTKGDLIGVTFAPNGTMVASFSNGQNTDLGIVALATFENQSGLQPIGDTSWSATLSSGQAILNPPDTGLNGQLRSAALEQSNVNLSEQLVKLIEAQRNFQANSKTLQTENAVTQNILQIS